MGRRIGYATFRWNSHANAVKVCSLKMHACDGGKHDSGGAFSEDMSMFWCSLDSQLTGDAVVFNCPMRLCGGCVEVVWYCAVSVFYKS